MLPPCTTERSMHGPCGWPAVRSGGPCSTGGLGAREERKSRHGRHIRDISRRRRSRDSCLSALWHRVLRLGGAVRAWRLHHVECLVARAHPSILPAGPASALQASRDWCQGSVTFVLAPCRHPLCTIDQPAATPRTPQSHTSRGVNLRGSCPGWYTHRARALKAEGRGLVVLIGNGLRAPGQPHYAKLNAMSCRSL